MSERGVAKVHPASKFAGADPPDGVAEALGDLANGRAKKIDEAGPLPGEGSFIKETNCKSLGYINATARLKVL